MKLAMSSWSYHWAISRGEMDQMQWLELCAALKLDGVELLDIHFPSLSQRYLKSVVKKCRELHLEIAAVSVSNDSGLPEKRLRAANRKKVSQWIGLAKDFGAPVLRVFSGWPGLGNRLLYEKERTRLWPEMIRHLRSLAERARAAGVVLALENHDHGGFTRTADDLLQILREVNSEHLKVALDTGDYLVDSAEINGYPALERVAYHAVLVHAKLYELDGQGKDLKQDYERIFDLLVGAGYDGYLSIEYEGPADPTNVPRGAKFLLAEMERRGIRG
jgi:sugar phosphate isomerase/epimerase